MPVPVSNPKGLVGLTEPLLPPSPAPYIVSPPDPPWLAVVHPVTNAADPSNTNNIFIIFIFISFLVKSRQEEKLMIKHFPKQYPRYKKGVKALIPFVY